MSNDLDLVKKEIEGQKLVTTLFLGEFGWFIQYHQAYFRYLKHHKYKDRKFVFMMNDDWHPLIHDFVTLTIDLPQWFKDLKLERDCYEAPLPDSSPGSLTPPDVYSNLIEYFRGFYKDCCDDVIEIWPPRGYNDWIKTQPGMYVKYGTDVKIESDRPIVSIFPRARSRAGNRNVPAFVWKEVVDALKTKFKVVIAGTPDGACLSDYEDENVVNLINYNEKDKLEKVMEYLCNSIYSVSSQSGPTHLSLLCCTPTYIIGHEKERHTVEENRHNAPASFRYVTDYRAIDAKTIIEDLNSFAKILLDNGLLRPPIDIFTEFKIARPSLMTLEGKTDLIGAEVGVDLGDNAINMLDNLGIKKLYLIDPYRMYDSCAGVGQQMSQKQCDEIKKVAHDRLDDKYSDRIVWIEEKSDDAVKFIKDELDFVYIDGNHRYEFIKKDIELYYDLVKDGGLVAGHDAEFPPIGKAVTEFFNNETQRANFARCNDDSKIFDWWVVKPTDYDIVIDNSSKTLMNIIKDRENG